MSCSDRILRTLCHNLPESDYDAENVSALKSFLMEGFHWGGCSYRRDVDFIAAEDEGLSCCIGFDNNDNFRIVNSLTGESVNINLVRGNYNNIDRFTKIAIDAAVIKTMFEHNENYNLNDIAKKIEENLPLSDKMVYFKTLERYPEEYIADGILQEGDLTCEARLTPDATELGIIIDMLKDYYKSIEKLEKLRDITGDNMNLKHELETSAVKPIIEDVTDSAAGNSIGTYRRGDPPSNFVANMKSGVVTLLKNEEKRSALGKEMNKILDTAFERIHTAEEIGNGVKGVPEAKIAEGIGTITGEEPHKKSFPSL